MKKGGLLLWEECRVLTNRYEGSTEVGMLDFATIVNIDSSRRYQSMLNLYENLGKWDIYMDINDSTCDIVSIGS